MRTLTFILTAVAVTIIATAPAQAAKAKSCYRGGAKLEAAADGTLIVRKKLKPQGQYQTRREQFLACRKSTGKRFVIVTEADNGLDNVASTEFEIYYSGRYVGVIATNTGGTSESVRAAVFDVIKRKKVHDSTSCDHEQGDVSGPRAVAFVARGGMAMACGGLFVYRNADAPEWQIEPMDAQVWNVASDRRHPQGSPWIYWIKGYGAEQQTKSMYL